MTFDDKLRIAIAFDDYRCGIKPIMNFYEKNKRWKNRKKVTVEQIDNYVKKLNLKRFYMQEPETKETIKQFLLDWYDKELNGEKFIDPNTFEIIRIKR